MRVINDVLNAPLSLSEGMTLNRGASGQDSVISLR